MTAALVLLAVQGMLGACDTLYFHEWKARLPARVDRMRPELQLHAVRSVIYGVLFCTLPWVAWTGPAAVLLAVLLAVEAVVTFTDFVVEDRVRVSLGGVYPGERVMHGVMAVVYGAFLAELLPVLGDPLGDPAPAGLRLGLTALGVGSLLSGLRDGLVASGVHAAAWPWPPDPSSPVPQAAPAPATAEPAAPDPVASGPDGTSVDGGARRTTVPT